MYGTLMRARLKAGRRADFEQFLHEIAPSADDYGRGLHSVELAWEDKDPNRVVAIIHFRDRESYLANAQRPETDADFRRQLEYFDGEPEWIDLHYADYVGRPLEERTATRS
jgi:quinol monooxygenase YgiN